MRTELYGEHKTAAVGDSCCVCNSQLPVPQRAESNGRTVVRCVFLGGDTDFKMDTTAVAAGLGDLAAEEDEVTTRTKTLAKNVHLGLPPPHAGCGRCSFVNGDYVYFHYGCDGQDDRGWGCGYRTIQTMASWICLNTRLSKKNRKNRPPSIPEIQQALVSMEDKPGSFVSSRGWIGTFEASLALDFFYDIPCKLVHVRGGGAELEQVAVEALHHHFDKHGSPVMMGGDRNNSSKGIVGVRTSNEGRYLLVVDPHYFGRQLAPAELQTDRRGWVSWRRISSLDQSSFYNLCMPQTGKE